MDAALSEIHRIQRSFRAVMEAMARPGRPAMMPLAAGVQKRYPGIRKPLATLIDMLVDQATTFSIANGCDEALADAVSAETHARRVLPDQSAFVIVPEDADAPCDEMAVAHAMAGSLIAPETGATVLIGCGRIALRDDGAESPDGNANMHWVSVEGPGVKESHVFGVDRIDWAWARNRREDEFPCGIDIVLADEQGAVVAVPRTSFVSLLAVAGGAK